MCILRMPRDRMTRRTARSAACEASNAVACTTCDCYVHTKAWDAAMTPDKKLALCPIANFRSAADSATAGTANIPSSGYAKCLSLDVPGGNPGSAQK